MLDLGKPVRERHRTQGAVPQRRIASLILAVVLVTMLMFKLGKPAAWQWMFNEAPLANPEQAPLPDELGDEPRRRKELPEGLIEVVPHDDPADKEKGPVDAVAEAGDYLPGLGPEVFQEVVDGTSNREQEIEPLFHAMSVLAETSPETLAQHSQGKITWRQLYQQPKTYRGQVIEISGRLVSADLIKADERAREQGVSEYYYCWVVPDDQTNRVINVAVNELPPGMPTGQDLTEDVRVTGVFFKRFLYPMRGDGETKGQLVEAPRIVAHTVEWHKPAPAAKSDSMAIVRVLIWGVGLGAAIVVLMFVGARVNRPKELMRRDRQDKIDAASLEKMEREAIALNTTSEQNGESH